MAMIGIEKRPHGKRGHRINVRIILTIWSPLTESNRRPSPYHRIPDNSAGAGQGAELREHQRTRALTVVTQALASNV